MPREVEPYYFFDSALAMVEAHECERAGAGGEILKRILAIYPTIMRESRVKGTPTITLLAITGKCVPPLPPLYRVPHNARPNTPAGRYTSLEWRAGYHAIRWAHRAALRAQAGDWPAAERMISHGDKLIIRCALLNTKIYRIMTGDVTWEFYRKRPGATWERFCAVRGAYEYACGESRRCLPLSETVEGVRATVAWDAPRVGE